MQECMAWHARNPRSTARTRGAGEPRGGVPDYCYDADDYMLATFGIPAVTAEMGFFGQYIKDWRCQSKSICHDIIRILLFHISVLGDPPGCPFHH